MIIHAETIKVVDWPYWFWLRVHDSHESITEACGETAYAFVQQAKTITHNRYAGSVHLSIKPHRQDIYHEAMHLASAFWRQAGGQRLTLVPLGRPVDHLTHPEERFAYLLATITDALVSIIESLPQFTGYTPVE
jgi:hypothetical protein